MTVISKLAPITTTCMEHVHPWTTSCWIATAGLLFQASAESLRIYSVVYILSLIMRAKIPNQTDLKRTLYGIMQSTAFLTTNAYTFSMFACLLRNSFGKFYFPTVTFIPAFLASLCAILVERPSRRGLLCFYVANIATESYWRMLVSRKMVKSIPYGQVLIFGLSATICMYLYRSGHHLVHKDSLFDSVRFVVGRNEEFKFEPSENQSLESPPERWIEGKKNNQFLDNILQQYNESIKKLKTMGKHETCPHKNSCLFYVVEGGAKLYCVGLGIQLTLSVVFQITKIIRRPKIIKDILLSKDLNKIALFLGGFCSIFRLVSCLLRHVVGKDCPEHAIPAGFLASLSFYSYPNISVALYVMWKTLQIVYNLGSEKGYLPAVPGFRNFLYCVFTATLFHVAMFEPTNLRPSYFKFLDGLSGGRIAFMERAPLDIWGLNTSKQLKMMLERTKSKAEMKFLF